MKAAYIRLLAEVERVRKEQVDAMDTRKLMEISAARMEGGGGGEGASEGEGKGGKHKQEAKEGGGAVKKENQTKEKKEPAQVVGLIYASTLRRRCVKEGPTVRGRTDG